MVESDVTFPAEDSRCEGCGYALRGLDISGNCPECGLAIAESSPVKRVGLPWQQKRTFQNWVRTNWMVLTKPRRAFRVMKLDAGLEAGLLPIQLLIASLLMILGFLFWSWLNGEFRDSDLNVMRIGESIAGLIPATVMVSIIYFLFTFVEIVGVWSFSQLGRQKISWTRVCQICTYAATGWFCTPWLMWVGVHLLDIMRHRGVFPRRALSATSSFEDTFTWLFLTCLAVIWFETLVWIGIRQVRFGNAAEGGQTPHRRDVRV